MKEEIREIPFDSNTLLGLKDENGEVWLAVKKACLDIGLSEGQAQRQITNIQEEEPLKSNCCKFAMIQNEGKREVKREQLFLNERVVTLWLAKISLTPTMMKKNPQAYDKLLKYQLEAADVLHKAFYQTEEQKEELHNNLGINVLIQKVDVMETKLDKVIDNMTLTTRQQQRIYKAAKDRINHLLGGAHSKEYKANSKSYFINLWNSLKAKFACGSSYKDLNPIYFDDAMEFIQNWIYVEN